MRKPPTLGSLINDDDATRTCIMLLFTFLYRRCTTKNVKVLNCSFCGGRERKTTTTFFLFPPWTLIQSQNSIPEKFSNIWRIERDGMSAIKLEASDVFVTVVVAELPILRRHQRFPRKMTFEERNELVIGWKRITSVFFTQFSLFETQPNHNRF